jgi:hypothetical protein
MGGWPLEETHFMSGIISHLRNACFDGYSARGGQMEGSGGLTVRAGHGEDVPDR